MLRQIFKITLALFYFSSISNAYTIDKGTELLNAVDKQNFEKVKELINSGVDINEKGKVGFTPLILAAGWGDVKMVKYLINNGANLNLKANRGFGVIHRASMNKNPAVLKYLLKNFQLNVNDRSKRYCSPLDFSLRNNALQNYGTLENAKLLITNGAKKSINWKCNGYTPLMVAVPDEKVVTFLVDNGADINIENASGATAYTMAKNQKASKRLLNLIYTQTNENKKTIYNKNLIWEIKTQENKYNKLTETQAKSYCKTLTLNGYTNWRIPTLNEYSTVLLDKPIEGYVIDGIPSYYLSPKQFPNLVPLVFWAQDNNGKIKYMNVAIKRSGDVCRSCIKNFIRCVR